MQGDTLKNCVVHGHARERTNMHSIRQRFGNEICPFGCARDAGSASCAGRIRSLRETTPFFCGWDRERPAVNPRQRPSEARSMFSPRLGSARARRRAPLLDSARAARAIPRRRRAAVMRSGFGGGSGTMAADLERRRARKDCEWSGRARGGESEAEASAGAGRGRGASEARWGRGDSARSATLANGSERRHAPTAEPAGRMADVPPALARRAATRSARRGSASVRCEATPRARRARSAAAVLRLRQSPAGSPVRGWRGATQASGDGRG